MIIKTASQFETDVAVGLKESLRKLGMDVYVIPKGVDYLYVTLSGEEDDIIVQAIKGESDQILDTTIGFNSCDEAYSYARKIAFEAGLDEDAVDGDVRDIKEEPEEN